MPKVLLGVTGSVASIRVPELYDQLKAAGHAVKIVATGSATYFFDPVLLAPDPGKPSFRDPGTIILDEDEWPGRTEGRRWQRGDPVLHIELRRWADLLLIAPLDANTLAKLALGITDNCLTSVYRAWDRSRPIVLAPAMNTLMWDHPATKRHLEQIAADLGSAGRFKVIEPISKKLACDDVGLGAMAEVEEIVKQVAGGWQVA